MRRFSRDVIFYCCVTNIGMNSMHPPSKCPNGREAFDLFPYDVDTSLV